MTAPSSIKIEVYVALASAFAAFITALFAFWQAHDANRASQAQAYLEMRQQFYEVNDKLSEHRKTAGGEWNSILMKNRADPAWPDFKQYWYISFDEWYITTRLGSFNGLWQGYFEDAIGDSLDNDKRPFRMSLCLLRMKEFSNGTRSEFFRALEEEFRKKRPNEGLCETAVVP